MKNFIFDLQRFVGIVISAGESYQLDGVTYTAVENSQLNLDSNGKISGISSGKVYAVASGVEDSPVVVFDAADGAINFSATGNGDAKVVTVKTRFSIEFIDGNFTYRGNTISFTPASRLAVVNRRENYSLRNENYFERGGVYTFTDTALISDSEHSTGNFILAKDGAVRQLQLESFGRVINNFTERGFTLAKGSSEVLKIGGYTLRATANENASMNISLGENGVTFVPRSGDGTLNLTLSRGDSQIFSGELECTNGSITLGYDKTVTFEKDTSFNLKFADYVLSVTAADNASSAVSLTENGFSLTPGENDGGLKISLTKGGNVIYAGEINVTGGTIFFDPTTKEFSLTKGTVISLDQGDREVKISALDNAGGKLNLIDGGIRFSPNEGDGALELNFVNENRKATINVNGAFVFCLDGRISLENGTEINLDWEDGSKLKLNSKGSTGSISLISEKGIRISSADENLDADLTMSNGEQTHLSGIKGTIYYNTGKVSFDPDSTITANSTLNGEPILTTLQTFGGAGSLDFSQPDGFVYSADTGAMKVTWTKDNLESTFTVNSGSVKIGHNIFKISEGTNLVTDLKNFIPALYFTTSEAGNYTINGQTVTTTAANLPLTATDNFMSFTTGENIVRYNDMTFGGSGRVSLSPANVVLGAGVAATGFGADKSFVLAEAGNVTADAKIFELTETVPTGITVTGSENGFTFSRTLTKESEERLGNYNSPDIGKIFTEKFIASGDDAYRVQTDLIGLQKIIGISDGATILGGAIFENQPEETVFDLVTDTEGVFTVADKSYTIRGDSSAIIKADFEPDKSYVRGFENLSGNVSGDFTSHGVSINGSAAVEVFDDNLIDIYANENGYEISGLDNGARLKVNAAGTYRVNQTSVNANAGDFIFGTENNSAGLYSVNDNVAVNGTWQNDLITNIGSNVTINGGTGNNLISNSGDNVTFIYDGGNDTVSGFKNNSTLLIGTDYSTSFDGENTVLNVDENQIVLQGINSLENLNIIGSVDGESISNINDNTLIGGTYANDFIENHGENVTVHALGGKDTIINRGAGSVIDGGTGSDTVDNREAIYVSVNMGAGHDFIFNEHAYYPTLDGGAGNDRIVVKRGHHTYIDGGAGNDTILGDGSETGSWAMGGYATINGGEGDDYINPFFSDSASIQGGAGNDTIINNGNDATMSGGTGDDVIIMQGDSLKSDVIAYNPGDGNYIIYGFNETSKLKLTPGTEFSSVESGDDVILTVGENNITIAGGKNLVALNVINYEVVALNIENTENHTVIFGTEFSDTIANSGLNVTVNGEAGDDYLTNSGANVSINGGAGNEIIENSGANSIIEGAEGDEILRNNAANVLIDGSYGNDIVENVGSNVTIRPGGGYDFISNSGNNVLIDYYGGDDTIIGFSENSTLQVGSGVGTYSVFEDKKNIIVSVGDYYANLVNAYLNNNTININGTPIEVKGKVIELSDGGDNVSFGRSNVSVQGSTGNDVITNYGSNVTINASTGNDQIIFANDAKSNFVKYVLGDGNDIINGANDGDKILLENISLEQIIGTNITEGGVSLNFNDGGSLTVNSAAKVTYQLDDGSELLADHEELVFTSSRR